MRCLTDTDLDLFAARALPHLVRDPVRHNLAYGLVAARRDGTVPVEPGAVWLRVVDGERLVTVALRTPPFPLLLTGAPQVAVDRLVDHLLDTGVELPDVSGPADLAARFADRWSAATGGEASVTGRARLFRLGTVTPPRGVPGRPRTATPADRERLVDWLTAFHAEAGPGGPSPGAAAVDRGLRRPDAWWLWEVDGAVVSMCLVNPPVAGVPRITAVYTPPERRGHGYASAGVAAASQWALDHGAAACMLYTDLANPTSNKIYQTIGYRPVGYQIRWRLHR
jgi:predicted GNAT family acetyltransferase